ncbi:MAG: CCA tRNA nucleotidyltransferase [Tenericutes bacterium HGW-Tenericutes-5]|nr:MAG: CCA tRNA nucleotidyltransferase [Tenericutes bacterium HGW-Tenericutes-5]
MNKFFSLGKIIIKKLHEFGYEAYFVGGFVRDYLLGVEPKDVDITTNALPEEVEEIFDNTRATGKKYGTITVFIEDFSFEVTTYRIDQLYLNHRKPQSVVFSQKLKEDLSRRDFTINALAMNDKAEVIDLFNGQDDLKNGIIRAIGNADERFKEDALRILRALRFVSRLNFAVEENTLHSMKNNLGLLNKLANERICSELEEIFANPYNKSAVNYMDIIGFKDVFSEFASGIEVYLESEYNLDFRQFFALNLYLSKKEIPEVWKLSNKDKLLIYKYVHILNTIKNTHFNPLILYKCGLNVPLQANEILKVLKKDNNQEELIVQIFQELPIKKREELAINGHDILGLQDINNEEIIGKVIDEIESQVVLGHLKNETTILKEYAKQLLERLDG